MQNFFNLSDAKKKAVIDAALHSFGANGYKKASVNDIAVCAGISKSMVFHYFGSKKKLYLYLIDYCISTIRNEISNTVEETTDFFEKIRIAAQIKLNAMKKHPAISFF